MLNFPSWKQGYDLDKIYGNIFFKNPYLHQKAIDLPIYWIIIVTNVSQRVFLSLRNFI